MLDLDLEISNVELARRFGVSEGTIRYHRKKEKRVDGRTMRYSGVSAFNDQIAMWISQNAGREPSKRHTIQSLYHALVKFHDFTLSYDALRRFVSKHYPDVMEKPYRIRVETPPGKLLQVDWKESVRVQLAEPGNWVPIHVLVLLLAFSRMPALVVRVNKDSQSFLSAHHEAAGKLGGITEFVRPDCMATAVKLWRGRKSQMHRDYAQYLESLGTQAFPARPGVPQDKGKVEKRIQDLIRDIDFDSIIFKNLAEVQQFFDDLVTEKISRWNCPATGTSIEAAYEYEKQYLASVGQAPQIPVDTATTTVSRESLVYFRGNWYQIPEGYARMPVRCINTGTQIQIFHNGKLIQSHDYLPGAKNMIRLSPQAISTTTRPMSDLTRQWALEVAERQMDLYQEIAGGM
jgi:transposase